MHGCFPAFQSLNEIEKDHKLYIESSFNNQIKSSIMMKNNIHKIIFLKYMIKLSLRIHLKYKENKNKITYKILYMLSNAS